MLAETRRTVWEQTYRGIYPDEMLDGYNVKSYAQRDRERIKNPAHHHYLFLNGGACVGYFSFGPYNYGQYKDFVLCLNNLYIGTGYRGRGLGKRAFETVRAYCRAQGIEKFFCGCNTGNHPAQTFYHHMGGIVGSVSDGHENQSENIVFFEFYLGD